MGLYQNNAGNLSLISGRGKAEYGASTMRTGTVNMTGNAGTGTWFSATVTFNEPMPDTNYLINLEVTNNAAYCLENIQFSNKTVNGFTMAAYHPTGTTATSIPVKYTAYKLYSNIEYSNIVESMPSDASTSNQLTTVNTVDTKIEAKTSCKNLTLLGSITTTTANTKVSFSQSLSNFNYLVIMVSQGYSSYTNIIPASFITTSTKTFTVTHGRPAAGYGAEGLIDITQTTAVLHEAFATRGWNFGFINFYGAK